jgi:hypothetical protein
MNVIIVTIDEQGNVEIDTNKVKSIERNKYIQPILQAIGNYSGFEYNYNRIQNYN